MDKLYEINFYYVKSDFCHIVNSLAKKLRDKKVLVNLSNELEMNFLDKYLWTKEKNEFLPHKTFTEKLNIRDNLVLFHGDYLKINNLLNFIRIYKHSLRCSLVRMTNKLIMKS